MIQFKTIPFISGNDERVVFIMPIRDKFLIVTRHPFRFANCYQCNHLGEISNFDMPTLESWYNQQAYFNVKNNQYCVGDYNRKISFRVVDDDGKLQPFDIKGFRYNWFIPFESCCRTKNYFVMTKNCHICLTGFPLSVTEQIFNHENANIHLIELNSMTLKSFDLPIEDPRYVAISRNEMIMIVANKREFVILDME